MNSPEKSHLRSRISMKMKLSRIIVLLSSPTILILSVYCDDKEEMRSSKTTKGSKFVLVQQ